MWPGSSKVELPVSPKSQLQEVMLPVERSVKLTASGTSPEVGVPEKSAAGAGIPETSSNESTYPLEGCWPSLPLPTCARIVKVVAVLDEGNSVARSTVTVATGVIA